MLVDVVVGLHGPAVRPGHEVAVRVGVALGGRNRAALALRAIAVADIIGIECIRAQRQAVRTVMRRADQRGAQIAVLLLGEALRANNQAAVRRVIRLGEQPALAVPLLRHAGIALVAVGKLALGVIVGDFGNLVLAAVLVADGGISLVLRDRDAAGRIDIVNLRHIAALIVLPDDVEHTGKLGLRRWDGQQAGKHGDGD